MVAPTGRKAGRTASFDLETVADYSSMKTPVAPKEYPLWARNEWKRVWRVGTWLHREQHMPLVRLYCEALIEKEKAEDALSEYVYVPGETTSRSYRQQNGAWAPYPEVRVIKELLAQLNALLIEMRMTPATAPSDTSAVKDILEQVTAQNRGRMS